MLATATRTGWWIFALVVCLPLAGQSPLNLTLEEANRRRPSDFAPARDGAEVLVQGVVASKAIRYEDFAHISLRDDNGFGLVIEAPDFMFERVTPGDILEVRGVLSHRNGQPVLRPVQITTAGHVSPPNPLPRSIEQLRNHRLLGLGVEAGGRVMALGEDAGGDYLLLEVGPNQTYPVYLPRAASRLGTGLSRFHVGDKVLVRGVASINASDPPYNTKYRMVVPDAQSVELVQREWFVAPQLLLAGALVLFTAFLLGVRQKQRRKSVRISIRRIHNFCEDLLTASNNEEVLRKLYEIAPKLFRITSVTVFRFDAASDALRAVAADAPADPIPLNTPPGSVEAAIAVCFRNRTPLHIPDTRRSPLFWNASRRNLPRSVVLLPMFAREELTGVMRMMQQERPHPFHEDELPALQHLANQAAIVLRLVEQQARKDQILRSQKAAVTGELISGVAGELRAPLQSIVALASQIGKEGNGNVRKLADESLRASAILNRITQVARQENVETAALEVNHLLDRMYSALGAEWRRMNLDVSKRLSAEPLWVIANASQLEHVLQNLLQLAAQTARESQSKTLRLESCLQGRRVALTVRYGSLIYDEAFQRDSDSEVLSYNLCRGILHGLGGDAKVLRAGENACQMLIDLPAVFPSQTLPAVKKQTQRARALTALLLEPDLPAQRRLIGYWSSRGHRAVPITGAGEALELLRRMKFDVIFCSMRVSNGRWIDFFDRVRALAPCFVLLVEALDPDSATLFPDAEGFVLRKPYEPGELNRVLEEVEQRAEDVTAVNGAT